MLIKFIFSLLFLLNSSFAFASMTIKVCSDNAHYFCDNDENFVPVIMDTIYTLHRLEPTKAKALLLDRKNKGFNAVEIYMSTHAENSIYSTNYNGDYAVDDYDLSTPNQSYHNYIKELIEYADDIGLYIVLTPFWCGQWQDFTDAQFDGYGDYLHEQYSGYSNVLWFVGGESTRACSDDNTTDINALADAIKGDGSQLITLHAATTSTTPTTGETAITDYNSESWLDYICTQSGQNIDITITNDILEANYSNSPTRPIGDCETSYDGIEAWNTDTVMSSREQRNRVYWNMMSGGAIIGVGTQGLWGTHHFGDTAYSSWGPAKTWNIVPFDKTLQMQFQMKYLNRLWTGERSFKDAAPAQTVLSSGESTGVTKVKCMQETSEKWAMCYLPVGGAVTIDMTDIAGTSGEGNVTSWWFNPRNGLSQFISQDTNSSTKVYTAPNNSDWVLILDDTSQGYLKP